LFFTTKNASSESPARQLAGNAYQKGGQAQILKLMLVAVLKYYKDKKC